MQYFSSPQQCVKCNGYLTIPIAWCSTANPIMCNCPKQNLSWECHRCKKVNAPWNKSCDCSITQINTIPNNEL
jgi:hypothetical protein